MDRETWQRASRQTEEYWRDIFAQAAPGYIAVAATLTDRQVAELMRNLEDKDEETWSEFAERTPDGTTGPARKVDHEDTAAIHRPAHAGATRDGRGIFGPRPAVHGGMAREPPDLARRAGGGAGRPRLGRAVRPPA